MTNTAADFLERIAPPNPNGCTVWLGTRCKNGYGQFKFGGRKVYAHRFSYRLRHGEIPLGLFVCHRCDNPPCVNPDHLFAGTASDNVRDAIAKGKWLASNRSQRKRSKLTPEKVHRIRYGGLTPVELTKEMDISFAAIRHIRGRKYWRDIP